VADKRRRLNWRLSLKWRWCNAFYVNEELSLDLSSTLVELLQSELSQAVESGVLNGPLQTLLLVPLYVLLFATYLVVCGLL